MASHGASESEQEGRLQRKAQGHHNSAGEYREWQRRSIGPEVEGRSMEGDGLLAGGGNNLELLWVSTATPVPGTYCLSNNHHSFQ